MAQHFANYSFAIPLAVVMLYLGGLLAGKPFIWEAQVIVVWMILSAAFLFFTRPAARQAQQAT